MIVPPVPIVTGTTHRRARVGVRGAAAAGTAGDVHGGRVPGPEQGADTFIENYRKAHAIHSERDATTEDLRQAMMHYRALFADLLEPENEAMEVK